MKHSLKFLLFISILVSFSSCATILGGKITAYQKTKPNSGQPSRQVRVGAFLADVVFFWPGVFLDFATGAIYKPYDSRASIVENVSNESIPELNRPIVGQFSSIIGKPIDLGNVLIAQFDFPEELTYFEAKQKVSTIGDGWRLPTKEELQGIICLNKSTLPNLRATSEYWSGTEGDRYNMQGSIGVQAFNVFKKLMYLPCDNGSYVPITNDTSYKIRVRLVKSK